MPEDYPRRGKKTKQIRNVFATVAEERYSEVLFSPEILLPIGGAENSVLGVIDSKISGNSFFLTLFARQHSLHIRK